MSRDPVPASTTPDSTHGGSDQPRSGGLNPRISGSTARPLRAGEDSRKCVLLLSGGLDSTTLLAQVTRDGWEVHALSVAYGQRHAAELDVARRIGERWNVAKHIVAQVDLRAFGGSALTADIDVPKGRELPRGAAAPTPAASAVGERNRQPSGHGEIPVTYVPARNTVFLSLALAWAEAIGACDIFIGVNALDYSGYPDCRPEYIRAFEAMANLATRAGVEGRADYAIHTPLIALSKAEIVTLGARLGVDFAETLSCYDPDSTGRACGACDSCQLRRRGFQDAGLPDPTVYALPVR